MNFELDKILLDDILFHMENQEGEFLFDAQERQIFDISNHQYDKDIDFGEDRFINIPSWDSGDGFRLMEKFISGLKNPVLREELAAALGRNKGVFRAFRDVLNQYPETEKQWYRFKDQEMKNEVLQWYNALREEWGLQPIGFEPEDNSCLVLEDFVVKEKTINKELNTFAFIAENAEGEL
ncbi:MAG: UPF0158 family protein, partial [Treponema sp.]|nr:UPF0158 family protein [Treponema sp.]